MGVRDIKISSISRDTESLTIMGDNFTEFSVIMIDGKKIETEFISKYCLKTADGKFDESKDFPQEIAVAQYTKNGEFLSKVEYKK